MAITIDQQPYALTALTQKLMFVLSSDAVAQPGFRYVVDVTISGDTHRVLIVPNAVNKGMFDLYDIARSYVKQRTDIAVPSTHNLTGYTTITSGDIETVLVEIYDGYEVAGVFTVDVTPSEMADATIYVFAGALPVYWGYRPDPAQLYGVSAGIGSPWLTNREANQYQWVDLATYGFTPGNQYLFPCNSGDYAVLHCVLDDGTNFSGNPSSWKIKVTVAIADGTEYSDTVTLSIPATPYYPQILVIGAGPRNISGEGGTDWVNTYDKISSTTRWIKWEILNGFDTVQGLAMVFVNIGSPCLYTTADLTWANTSKGGWDQFKFELKNEVSHDIERKRFRKNLGTYNSTTFDFLQKDRGMEEFEVTKASFFTLTSNWVTEGEYRFLRQLLLSKDVYILNWSPSAYMDGQVSGTNLPVVVEESSWLERADKSGNKYNLTIKVRFANDYFPS